MSIIVAKPAHAPPLGDASVLVLTASSGLRNERVITPGLGVRIEDAGPNSTATISLDPESLGFQVITGSIPVSNEEPSGSINGVNTTFTLSQEPYTIDAVRVFINGIRQKSGSSSDYTVSSPKTITFQSAPTTNDQLTVDYFVSGSLFVVGSSKALQPLRHDVPSESINGVNTTFTLSFEPANGTDVRVFLNGIRQKSGSTSDYSFTPNKTLQFTVAPTAGDQLVIEYFRSGTTNSNAVAYRPVINDTPSGSLNGINTTFSLTYEPASDSYIELFVNGVRQKSGSTSDYTIDGHLITMQYAPAAGDQLIAEYYTSISGSYAPLAPSYIVASASAGLPNERILSAGRGIDILDNGSNGTLVVSANQFAAFPPVLQLITSTVLTTGSIVLANATSAELTLTLPPATSSLQFIVKKIDASANAVIVSGTAGQTIDGVLGQSSSVQWQTMRFVATNSAWFMI